MVYYFNYRISEYTDSNGLVVSEVITPPSPGDIIIVDLGYDKVELIARKQLGCDYCYFTENENGVCNGGLHCSVNNVVFSIASIDDKVVKIRDIRNRLCNPDICVYCGNLCDKGIPKDDYRSCLLKIIIGDGNI